MADVVFAKQESWCLVYWLGLNFKYNTLLEVDFSIIYKSICSSKQLQLLPSPSDPRLSSLAARVISYLGILWTVAFVEIVENCVQTTIE